MPKKTIQVGSLVEIITDSEKVEGVLMPSIEKDITFIKLNSGYNMGIDNKKIKKISLIKKPEIKKEETEKVKTNKALPTISILHTGGTISSKVDYNTGAVSARFTPEELISMFPRLKDFVNINSRLIRNMWSDDLRFKHFELIAKEIEREVKNKVDGIIIGIGTDNLAVASAALSFIIEKTPIPIIFVGAQRSSDRGSTDALLNLTNAAFFISKSDFADVAICMHENTEDENCLILPATKTRKMHSSRRDAFKPINDTPIARVNFIKDKIEFLKHEHKKRSKEELIIKPKMEEKVGLLKITVNMNPKQFEFFKGYKGLIIEGTGLGHMPCDVIDEYTKPHENIKKALKKLISSGTIVVMTTQTLYGKINMNVYSKGRDLQESGVLGNYSDMLPETAFVKLSWLLANYKKDEVKKLILEDLRGEISKRTNLGFI